MYRDEEIEIKNKIENDSKLMVSCMGCGERTGVGAERVIEEEICNRCTHISLMDMVEEQERMETYFKEIKGKQCMGLVTKREIEIYREEKRVHIREKEIEKLKKELYLRKERLLDLRGGQYELSSQRG